MKDETSMIHLGETKHKYEGAVVPPIFQNSLFTFNGWDAIDEAFSDPQNSYIYTRGNNPTVEIVEKKIAKLCRGEKAKMFASGMGAISAAILHCVEQGDHIITINNVYGPVNNFLNNYMVKKCGVTTTFVDGNKVSDFEEAIKPNTKLIYLESPSSVVFSIQDIQEITKIAKRHHIKTIIDNTWATPIFQKPLELGVDFEVHSCSKYLGGHSDVVAGVIIGAEEEINHISANEGALLGAKMAPFEAWLILRSLRTLSIRMKQHMASTITVVNFLKSHPLVESVSYPGDPEFNQRELVEKQMTGYSGLFSFKLRTDDQAKVKKFVDSLDLFKIGVSWGGHESLIYVPAISLSKELSKDQFEIMGLSFGDVRIAIGLEDPNDLIEDLTKGLNLIL